MKTITQDQYLQLVGLSALARECQKRMTEITNCAVKITGEKDSDGNPHTCGHTSDILYENRGLDEGLRIMGIEVLENPE